MLHEEIQFPYFCFNLMIIAPYSGIARIIKSSRYKSLGYLFSITTINLKNLKCTNKHERTS